MSTEQPATEQPAEVPVWGAKAIARVLGVSERSAFHLLETGALGDAARKVGGSWAGFPSRLRAKCGGSA